MTHFENCQTKKEPSSVTHFTTPYVVIVLRDGKKWRQELRYSCCPEFAENVVKKSYDNDIRFSFIAREVDASKESK